MTPADLLAFKELRRTIEANKQREALLARAAELASQIKAARAARPRLPVLLTEPDEDNCEPWDRMQAGWRMYEQQRDADGPYSPFRQFWKAAGL